MPPTPSSAEVAEIVEEYLQQDPELSWGEIAASLHFSTKLLRNMLDEADRTDLVDKIAGETPDTIQRHAPLGPRPPVLTRGDTTWMERRACKGEPLQIFYPEEIRSSARRAEATRIAKSICSRCPVRSECLVDALDVEVQDRVSDGPHGIRGGLTRNERRPMITSLRLQQGKEHLS